MFLRHRKFLGWVVSVCASALLASCTSEQFRRYTRPVTVYVERTELSTDFDPRDLRSDGEGFTVGVSYNLGVALDGGPLTADAFSESLMAALARMQPSIEQNVSVGQQAQQEAAQAVLEANTPWPGDPDFIGPMPVKVTNHEDGWPSEAKIAAIAAAIATVLAAWHKIRGLPGTRRRRDKRAFRRPVSD